MIEIYLKIWERILAINPSVRMHITTNGTFLNNRIKNLLEGLRAGIILSIDSVNKETYSKIRVNGNFDKVMENLEYLLDYTRRKKTFISMAACPIIYNWRELPEMLNFCLERNIALYFNVVFTPQELSLKEQPIDKLKEIITWLEKNPAPEKKGNAQSPRNLSIAAYNDFINLLKGWLQLRKQQQQDKMMRLNTISEANSATQAKEYVYIKEMVWSADTLQDYLFKLTDIYKKGFFEEEKKLQTEVASLLVSAKTEQLAEIFRTYLNFYILYSGIQNEKADEEKVNFIASLIQKHPSRNEVLIQISKVPPLQLGELFYSRATDTLQNDLKAFFG